jgi:alpha-L-rhamnosidase
LDAGRLHLDVVLPPGTEAAVYIPDTTPEAVTEGDGPALEAQGVSRLEPVEGSALFRVEAGRYAFAAPAAETGD